MNTVAIIQARMASTRLPGKVLTDIGGQPMLWHVVRRAQKVKHLDRVVVATSTDSSDDPVFRFCKDHGFDVFRGSQTDVLDRYYQAANSFSADVVVRLTADCPLLDSSVIERVIALFLESEFDYTANILKCTYPDGLDTEVFSFMALEQAWRQAMLKSEREHVTPYIRNHPDIFNLGNVNHVEDLSSLRWTVDEPEDLDFVRAVYSHFKSNTFYMEDILKLLSEQPGLLVINQGIKRNEGYLKSVLEDKVLSA